MGTFRTWIEREEMAYPNGAMRRKGRALVVVNPHNPVALPYGEIRAFRAGIPDSAFTVPGVMRYRGKRIRGYISSSEDGLTFKPEADPEHCTACKVGEGCKR